MRRTLASLAAGAVATFGLAVVAPPASAGESTNRDTVNCVTRAEYRRVDDGMTINRVEIIFDQRGPVVFDEGRYLVLVYDMCNSWHRDGEVYVTYKKRDGVYRVIRKDTIV